MRTLNISGPEKRTVECSFFEPDTTSGVVIIAPSMGTPRRFYEPFARWLEEQGYAAIIFDYFGMFKTPENKNREVHILNWGFKDLEAVIQFAKEKFPELPLFYVGHSVGGQILPLPGHANSISAAVLAAAQNASKNHWSGFVGIAVRIFWYGIIPFCTTFMNGLPGWAYGGKYELHPRVAKEWGGWGRNPRGMLGTSEEARKRYREIDVPVKFLSFYDDTMFAPKASVQQLYNDFGSTVKEHTHITKSMAQGAKIRHFYFFRPELNFLWPMVTEWFEKNRDS